MPDRPYNASLSQRARELRKNATKQENRLWYEYLRAFRPRFSRQRIVGSYILDFYCGTAKLAVELDGSGHYEPEAIEYDKRRTRFLESLGIQVMRFTNTDVNRSLEGVCNTIANQVNARLGQPPPSAGGTPFVREGGPGGGQPPPSAGGTPFVREGGYPSAGGGRGFAIAALPQVSDIGKQATPYCAQKSSTAALAPE